MEDLFEPWHLVILGAVAFFLVILPFWQIFKKAGFSPALSLLMFLPFVSTIVLYVVAFSDWPALKGPALGPGSIPPAL